MDFGPFKIQRELKRHPFWGLQEETQPDEAGDSSRAVTSVSSICNDPPGEQTKGTNLSCTHCVTVAEVSLKKTVLLMFFFSLSLAGLSADTLNKKDTLKT